MRLDNHFLGEIRIPGLTHGDLMLTGQKQDFFVLLELSDVAKVLSVDPHAGRLVRLGLPDKLHFPQDLALGAGCGREHQEGEKEAEKHFVEHVERSHDQPPDWQFSKFRTAWERFGFA